MQPTLSPDMKQRLIAEYTGINHESMAHKYGISVSEVYRIILHHEHTQNAANNKNLPH